MPNDPPRDPVRQLDHPAVFAQRWAIPEPAASPAASAAITGPPSAVGTAELDGRPMAITTAGDTIRIRDLADGHLLRSVRFTDAARATEVHPLQREGSPAVLIKYGTSARTYGNTGRVLDLLTATWVCSMRTDTPMAQVHPGIFIIARGDDAEPNHIAVGTFGGRPFALTTPRLSTHTMWSYDLTTGDPITAAYIDGAVLGLAVITEPQPNRGVVREHPLVLVRDTRQYGRHLVRTYDLRTHLWRGEFPTRASAATATRLDGRTVVVTTNGHNVRVWDLTTESPLGTTIRHVDPLTDMAIATWHDHPVLITASVDSTVRAWDLKAGDLVAATALPAPAWTLSARDSFVVCNLRRGAVTTLELSDPD